jgi:hypothetical protein
MEIAQGERNSDFGCALNLSSGKLSNVSTAGQFTEKVKAFLTTLGIEIELNRLSQFCSSLSQFYGPAWTRTRNQHIMSVLL